MGGILPPEARTVSEREKSSYAAHLCVAWRSSQVQGPGVGEATRPFISAMPPIATGWVPRTNPSDMCHVWTAPSWQGFSSRLQAGRCSHVFGLFVRFT
jgi:hypothetical protein